MSNQSQPYPIPAYWKWSRIGEIGEVQSGSTPSTKDDSNFGGKIPWLTPADLSDYQGKYIREGSRNITEKGLSSCSARLLPEGSVLFSSRAPIGYTVIAKNPISTNQGFKNLIPGDSVTSEYVYHYLLASKSLAESFASGTTFKELSAARFKKIPIPVPPLPEQHRIVDKIEELFSNLDAGVASLKTARRQVDRYRQSVLQAAVEGRLTADWRQSHDPEPAEELLERILEERRVQWENDYRAKYEAKGKEPPSGWKKRYKEPESPDNEDLPALPEGWVWTSLGQAFDVHVGATPRRSREEYWDGEIRWANSSEINQRSITDTEETITEEGLNNCSTDVHPAGTLLLGMIGQGPTRGMVAKLEVPAAHSQNSAAIRVSMSDVPPMFVYFYLESQYQALRRLGSGNNQKALNKGITQKIPIPLSPLAEQKQIVAEVERLLSVADDTAATIDRGLQRAERLRQSILKQAFSGTLVAPDPDSAPAPQPTAEPTGQVTMDL
ncbi:MAG: hypothetical protein GVY15_09215 [Bacteroidetes bacterium]|jgi:type I restriction enzyme S subunit|nr:hypothetical protein [Bacteroidota bacterium]